MITFSASEFNKLMIVGGIDKSTFGEVEIIDLGNNNFGSSCSKPSKSPVSVISAGGFANQKAIVCEGWSPDNSHCYAYHNEWDIWEDNEAPKVARFAAPFIPLSDGRWLMLGGSNGTWHQST